jgi:mono/diheme cytochrome c family protein
VLLTLALFLGGCELQEGWPWVRNMFDSPSPQPQELTMYAPQNTLPTAGGELPAFSDPGEVLENPERSNDVEEALARGKMLFDRYCAVCHGRDAKGVSLTEDFESPDLTEENYLESLDGEIYNIMVEGGLSMPSYRVEIGVRDRWLVVNYLRTLQENR